MPVALLGSPEKRDELIKKLKPAFTPNEQLEQRYLWMITAAWALMILAVWELFHPVVLPSAPEVLGAFPDLWNLDGLGEELITSFTVNLQALVLSTIISLPVAYLSRTPVFRPGGVFISKLRFLSPAMFFAVLIFMVGGGHMIKVWMLTLGETFFLTTTMIGIVENVPEFKLDDARTLRMNEWLVTWYTIVRGTVDQAFDAIRDNAAMGWSMLMMVEGIVRSEGGVGVMMLNQDKHMNFAAVYAIAFSIIFVGLAQDYGLKTLKEYVAPYSVLPKRS